jgi:hypothetical protein
MDTILNPIAVPGWEQLKAEHPTRALTLQALTNLELAYYLGHEPQRPTRKSILAEVIRLGGDLPPGGTQRAESAKRLSPTSLQTVQRHLDALVEDGHALKTDDGKSPWRSRYLALPMPVKGK